MKERINYYKNLVADYSKPGLVPNDVKKDEAYFITGTQLFVDGGLTAVLEEW
ncbi:MAG TPA: hypothetical protein V6D30_19850 [Leptolyngbyaceae cyanobacterium]